MTLRLAGLRGLGVTAQGFAAFAGFALLAMAGTARAEGAAGAAILNVPLSVRQAGMGGVSAGGADVMRAWSNPALLAGQATRGEVALGGGSMFGGTQTTMGAGVGWMLTPAWTLGAVAMSYSAGFDELNASGASAGSRVDRSVQSGGVVAAVRVGPAAVGLGVRGVADALAGNTATTGAADAGVSAGLDGFAAAAAIRNVGAGLRAVAESGPDGESLPREIRAGASYRFAPMRISGGVEYAGVAGRDAQIGAGAEWWPAAALGLRAGAGVEGPAIKFSAGLSAVFRGYALDYALTTHVLGATHRASLTYAFGPTAPELAALRLEDSLRAAEAAAALRREDALRGATEAAAPAVQAAPPVAAPAASRRSTLAVASFDPQNVSAGDAAVIADMFRSELVKQGRFDVVEKSNMDKILMEQAFQQSGCTTAECAVKLGKILNVRYLVVGSFGKLMDQYVVSFRMVETETAKVVFSDDARELSSQRDVYKAITAMTARLGRAYGSK